MRPRFTIRWLLVLIALTATSCYVLFVRPTVMAHRFITAIENRDYAEARGLLRLDNNPYSGRMPPLYDVKSIDYTYAEVLPREWNDIWALQRRLILRVRSKDDSQGRHIEWTEDWDVVAHVNGLDVMHVDSVRFTPKGDGIIIKSSPRQREDAGAKID